MLIGVAFAPVELDDTMPTPDWKLSNCRKYDTELFFAEQTEKLALTICHKCPIMLDCRQWALVHKEKHGVWGGLTEKQLRVTGHRKSRVRCPSCRSTNIVTQQANGHNNHSNELCNTCGLSWAV